MFQAFDLQPEYDYLYVYDGDASVASLSLTGADTPADIFTTSPLLRLEFVTNADTTRLGFTATVTFVPTAAAGNALTGASTSASSSSSNVGVIVGPVVGGVAFVVIVVAAVVLLQRRRQAQKSK